MTFLSTFTLKSFKWQTLKYAYVIQEFIYVPEISKLHWCWHSLSLMGHWFSSKSKHPCSDPSSTANIRCQLASMNQSEAGHCYSKGLWIDKTPCIHSQVWSHKSLVFFLPLRRIRKQKALRGKLLKQWPAHLDRDFTSKRKVNGHESNADCCKETLRMAIRLGNNLEQIYIATLRKIVNLIELGLCRVLLSLDIQPVFDDFGTPLQS